MDPSFKQLLNFSLSKSTTWSICTMVMLPTGEKCDLLRLIVVEYVLLCQAGHVILDPTPCAAVVYLCFPPRGSESSDATEFSEICGLLQQPPWRCITAPVLIPRTYDSPSGGSPSSPLHISDSEQYGVLDPCP